MSILLAYQGKFAALRGITVRIVNVVHPVLMETPSNVEAELERTFF